MRHTRKESQELMEAYVRTPALRNHSQMVAKAMEAYAMHLGKSKEEIDMWWTSGLLHDLDWEMFPDEHPNQAVFTILPDEYYEQEIINAVAAHAPDRSAKEPVTEMERYLFACDELCGFINAASLVRPERFTGMEVKSVKKKLKDKNFAANVSRKDIEEGARLIGTTLDEHITFLITVFSK